MTNRVICNASPLIFLSKIDRLSLLDSLFDEILVPSSVWSEVTRKPDSFTDVLTKQKESGIFSVFTVENRTAVSAMIGRLHIGEVEVIIGAGETGISNVILDDGYARSKAKQMGLNVTGTLGVLIAAKQKNIVTDINSEIISLQEIGFRISDAIVERVVSMFD